jgi:hypothetical protein
VARIVSGNIKVLLLNASVLNLHQMIILLLVVSVCVLSGDYDYILVIDAEGDLIRYGLLICGYYHQ